MGPGFRRDDSDILGHTSVFSRQDFRPSYASHCSPLRRGRRESRAPDAPVDPVHRSTRASHAPKHMGKDYRYSRDIPAIPTQWFTAYTYSPRGAAFLAPVACRALPANVAPGSRRQDHTTSPYAADVSPGGQEPT